MKIRSDDCLDCFYNVLINNIKPRGKIYMKDNQFTPIHIINRDRSSFKVREFERDSAFGNRHYAFLENFCLASRQASPLKLKFDQFDRSFGGKKIGVVTFSVLVALGAIFSPTESFAFPASLTQNGDEWTFGVDSGFTIVTDPDKGRSIQF